MMPRDTRAVLRYCPNRECKDTRGRPQTMEGNRSPACNIQGRGFGREDHYTCPNCHKKWAVFESDMYSVREETARIETEFEREQETGEIGKHEYPEQLTFEALAQVVLLKEELAESKTKIRGLRIELNDTETELNKALSRTDKEMFDLKLITERTAHDKTKAELEKSMRETEKARQIADDMAARADCSKGELEVAQKEHKETYENPKRHAQAMQITTPGWQLAFAQHLAPSWLNAALMVVNSELDAWPNPKDVPDWANDTWRGSELLATVRGFMPDNSPLAREIDKHFEKDDKP